MAPIPVIFMELIEKVEQGDGGKRTTPPPLSQQTCMKRACFFDVCRIMDACVPGGRLTTKYSECQRFSMSVCARQVYCSHASDDANRLTDRAKK